ncbi:MAG TPA: FtsX-like permease family protein [Blastocatellia bacterium]|nr:FtsX-like permease family protein [Blastocatellia bacterium]
MRFVFQMARRELRASWRRLLFFFICIAIGVGAIVALKSMTQNINLAVASEARSLLTADVQVDSNRPWTNETLEVIDRVSRSPLVTARVETIESATMLRPADPSNEGAMMIELKGIDPGFPLYGDFMLKSGERFDYSFVEDHGAIVGAGLLDRLQLSVGDQVKIGNSTFEIRGVLSQEPGGAGGFRLGPRVFIERSALEGAGLTGFGSRARRRVLFATPEGSMQALVNQLRADLKNQLVSVRSYKDSQENLNESLSRAEDYLSLTGLVILVLGGLGISNVTRVFIEQKKKTIAVLKCVGGTGGKVSTAYLAQVLALGLAGSILGVVFARVVLFFIATYFAESLPQNLSYGLQPRAIAQGLGVGILITILFSALPLLRIRRIKPNVLLRDDTEQPKRSFDTLRLITGLLVTVGLVALVSWQAGSLKVGLFFLGGLAVTALALYLAAGLLIWMVRRVRNVGSFAMRQAINSLYRPGNQTRVIVMVVGLGVFLIISIQSVQSNLLREFDFGRQGNLPNLILIEIQKDQREGVERIIKEETGQQTTLIPTVRMRIVAINGKEIDFEQGEMQRNRGRLGREYVVTYRPNLEVNEKIVAGEFWGPEPSPDPEISIEESMRGMAGLDLGSTITFDIQGRKLTARVTSFREVDWRNSRTGFMILFRPGSLENAPQMLIGAINGPTDELERARFQRIVLDEYPNISIIDVTDIVASIKRIVGNITLAVSFLGGFVFLSGALILIGSIAMTKFQRIYEAAVLKTLGAKRKTLLIILLAEYGLLGLVAGIIGSAAAIGLSYATSRYVFDIDWSPTPEINLAGIAITVAMVVVVGAASTIDVLTRKPLAILRAQ